MTKYKKLVHKPKKRRFCDITTPFVLLTFVTCLLLLLFTYTDSISDFQIKQQTRTYEDRAVEYTYTCENDKCVRQIFQNGEKKTLETCNMLCPQPPLWPKPAKIQITERKINTIDVKKIAFDIPCRGDFLLSNATNLFLKNLKSLSKNTSSGSVKLNINIIISRCFIRDLDLATKEGYKLLIRHDSSSSGLFAYISADNFFGARHGLQTLEQLIWFDQVDKNLKILSDVTVEDSPKFAYRGLMLDTARNYFPLDQIKQVVDGMSMAKLNVLHLHLTDAVSFPVILPRVRQLAAFGAYAPDLVYTSQDIVSLREFAKIRGIRLVLEIDAPGHVNAGWNFSQEKYVICGEKDVLNGHLNPDNPDVMDVLVDIYQDLLDLNGQKEIFHIGSDEVDLDCWKQTESVKKLNYRSTDDMVKFWANFTNQMLETLKKANNDTFPDNVVMWSSPLTTSQHFKTLSANITIQSWLGSPKFALEQGHSVIYSTVGNWYLDCGFGPWKPIIHSGNCDPYTHWLKFYKYKPWNEFGHREKTLGGEVCLWTEQVDVDTLETRIWPRTAAFAERVWSDPDDYNIYDISTRLVSFRERLKVKGIKSEQIWPRWCSDNPGKC